MVPNFFTFREVVEMEVHELAVGDVDESAVERPYLGRAKPDLFDRPDFVAKPTEVSHAYRPGRVQRNAADQVLERLLRSQGHRDAADAEPCHQCRYVEADIVEPHDDGGEDDAGLDAVAQRM